MFFTERISRIRRLWRPAVFLVDGGGKGNRRKFKALSRPLAAVSMRLRRKVSLKDGAASAIKMTAIDRTTKSSIRVNPPWRSDFITKPFSWTAEPLSSRKLAPARSGVCSLSWPSTRLKQEGALSRQAAAMGG